MTFDRRNLLKWMATLGATTGLSTAAGFASSDKHEKKQDDDKQVGCLVDTTLCIGCRQCEEACNRRNGLPQPETSFKDKSVFRDFRRPHVDAFTVVNEFPGGPSPDQGQKENTYAKAQCMHCLDPACVSGCITGALSRAEDGAVVYNPTICLGCRYCMVACPFQVPAFEYHKALMPRLRKCEFCVDRAKGTGANPACAAACPVEAIVFGKRKELLTLAKERIKTRPDRYIDHIYGEHEVGGTAWLYLMGRPQTELRLLELPEDAPPRLTEAMQHTIFKYGALPIAFYGLLGIIMWRNNRKDSMGSDTDSIEAQPDERTIVSEEESTDTQTDVEKPEGGDQ